MSKKDGQLSRKFLSGEVHFGFWDSVSTCIGLLNTFFIVSGLTIYQYGVFQLLLSIYAIFNNTLALGGSVVGNDILRFIGEGDERRAKKLYLEYNSLRLVLGILLGSFMFFGTHMLSHWYTPDAVAYVRPLAFLLILEVIFSALKSLLMYRLRFALTASRATLYKIAQLSVLIFFFSTHRLGVEEVVYSMISGSILSSLVLIRPAFQAYRMWRGTKASKENVVFWVFSHHGKWDLLQQFTAKLTSNLQPWVIKIFVGTEAVAVYSIAQTIVGTIVGFFPIKTLTTLVPLQVNNPERMQKIFSYGTKYLFLFSLCMILFSATFGPLGIYLIFPKYIPSLPYFFVLIFGMPVSALSSIVSLFLVAVRKQEYLFYQKILKVFSVLPMVLFVYLFGLWGLTTYQIVFALLLFLSAYTFLRKVPPGYHLGWREFFFYTDEDRAFLRSFWSDVRGPLKKKFSFLPIR